MEKKIKDIYHVEPITTDLDDTLVEWHNSVIEKTVDQLTEGDVARCIRQDIFVESAVEALLAYLLENPLAGELYEGELMEKAAEVNDTIMKKHRKSIQDILESARNFLENHEWFCDDNDEDKCEFQDAVEFLEKRYLR